MAINNCCSDFQSVCNKVVTIGYLKTFIGNDIHSTLDDSVITISRSDDTYCPTFYELTNGSIVPLHTNGMHAHDDVDGINVKNTCYGTNVDYASNQLVCIADLSLSYTRFKSFDTSIDPTEINACEGEQSSISPLTKFTRYTKSVDSNCSTALTNSDVSDTTEYGITWVTTDFGRIEFPVFIADKNGDAQSLPRTTDIVGTLNYRGTAYVDSNTLTQRGLSGDYTHVESTYEVVTGVTANALTPTSFNSCLSVTYSADCVAYYDIHTIYSWVDSCDDVHHDITRDEVTASRMENLGTKSGTFTALQCPIDHREETSALSWTLSGLSDSVSFERVCDQTCTCEEYDDPPVYIDAVMPCSGGTVTVQGSHKSYRDPYWEGGVCKYRSRVDVDDSYTVTSGCNPDNTARWVDDHVQQMAGPCCCNSLTANGLSNCIDISAHTNYVVGTYTALAGVTNITVTDKPSWLSSVTVDTTNKQIKGNVPAVPCEGPQKSGIVELSYVVGGQNCSTTFNVCQSANNTACPCTDYSYSAICSAQSTSFGSCSDTKQVTVKLKRKCIAPHASEYEDVSTYYVTWSNVSSSQFITITSPNSKTTNIATEDNCTESSRSNTLRATVYADSSRTTQLAYCDLVITQAAGLCPNCECQSFEYSATCPSPTAITVNNCGGSGDLSFNVYEKCTNPSGEWHPYASYTATVAFKSGNDIATFNGVHWEVGRNCDTTAKSGIYTLTIKTNNGAITIGTCDVELTLQAGPCTTCDTCDCNEDFKLTNLFR